MALPVGLANLGNSCFINASVQCLAAVPALREAIAAGTSEKEVALQAVLRKLDSHQPRIVPRELTAVYYHGRQEDAAEFLVLLLAECPGLHPSLRGLEVPLLRCRHCGYERTSQPEEFLSLQISVREDNPMTSVQEAMTHYLQRTEIRQDFTEWSCENPECMRQERALDEPVGFNIIPEWPQVLQLLFKRWTLHDVVGHKVHCNDVLDMSGKSYRLQALITHIGRSANAGHYVAYIRHGSGFLRMSDTSVSHVPQDLVGDFVSLPDEKVYVVFYVALPAAPRPDEPVRVPVLDIDGTDSDSDVIIQHDSIEPAVKQPSAHVALSQEMTMPSQSKRAGSGGQQSSVAKKTRTSSYTADEQRQIDDILEAAKTVPEALKQLTENIPGFTTKDKKSDRYMARSTVQYRRAAKNRPKYRQAAATKSSAWTGEAEMYFKPFQQKPSPRTLPPPTTKAAAWAQSQSWTFCSKCGRHRPRTASLRNLAACVDCKPECDPTAKSLLVPGQVSAKKKLMAYVTPQPSDWDEMLAALDSDDLATALTTEDLETLVVVDLYVDFKTVRGGKSDITSLKKQSVVRAEWRAQPLCDVPRSRAAATAFAWLLNNNTTYKEFVEIQASLCSNHADNDASWRRIATADLLLNKPGIEVACRPWLYPYASYGDTDLTLRLRELDIIKTTSKPSLRASWERKSTSRCVSYVNDFKLQCLLYDVAMAKTISTVASLAASKKMAPESLASEMDMFDTYWHNQIHKMEDICRLEFERHQCMDKAMPNVFVTIAPAEWTFPLQEGLFFADSLSKQQTMLSRHICHVLDVVLHEYLLKPGPHLQGLGLAAIRQWSFRYEFQSRGTVHAHLVLWVDLVPGVTCEDLSGRTNTKHNSALVKHLESLFNCRIDVQAARGGHILMRYVMGYVHKASDALSFKATEASGPVLSANTTWRTTYRLLCKKAPLEQEIALEFAGKSMVRHSFFGCNYYAPIPGSAATNLSRAAYNAFQHGLRRGNYTGYSYLAWLRDHRIEPSAQGACKVTPRTASKKTAKDVGVAVQFPFELLDIFVGAWAATFLVAMDERRLWPGGSPGYPKGFEIELKRRNSFDAPQGCQHLKAVLCLDDFQMHPERTDFAPDVARLLVTIEQDLIIRGLAADRIATFKARVNSCALLLQRVAGRQEDPTTWSARRIFQLPQRVWSKEQNEVLQIIAEGTNVQDANELDTNTRLLHVKGGLRSYDLIIFDEISQIDAHVWRLLQTALADLHPQPFVVFVGDFQQLQPITGLPQLQLDLERQTSKNLLPTIELQPHAAARSTDPVMLDFLGLVRTTQPPRATLEHFFRNRIFPKQPDLAAQQARAFEIESGEKFTFLTVTNPGAYRLNIECLKLDYPQAAAALAAGAGYPADSSSGQDRILVEVGMRLRLTRNLDKDRGFVNGNLGIVETMLRPDVFVVKTMQDVLILVHPITVRGRKFIPACYAYATTIRRAQGATLAAACLRFDRPRPDRGYAYVGASRVKYHGHLFHMGRLRRTDWLPVNGDPDHEQLVPSAISESTDSEQEHEPDTTSDTDPDPSNDDFPSSYSDPSFEPSWGSDSDFSS
ncbi:UBP23 [Symbiodinium sp. CCMP2456]|nr:UBP23 [Symbiodinium sp. CCMP2456]